MESRRAQGVRENIRAARGERADRDPTSIERRQRQQIEDREDDVDNNGVLEVLSSPFSRNERQVTHKMKCERGDCRQQQIDARVGGGHQNCAYSRIAQRPEIHGPVWRNQTETESASTTASRQQYRADGIDVLPRIESNSSDHAVSSPRR